MTMMKKLVDLISQSEAGEILRHPRALIALLERDGTFVACNEAFDSYRTMFPSANMLEDFFSQKDKGQVAVRLDSKFKEHWIVKFPVPASETDQAHYCDCLLIGAQDDRRLFIADEINSDPAFQEVIDRLGRQAKMFQIESEIAKKIARNKQVEMELVMIQAQEVAQIDALTFLYNRRVIVKELQDEVLRAERYKSQLSVSVVDVDRFKSVNDTYGHIAGDEVLRSLALQLKNHIRHPDAVGRYGGEEFLILLPSSDAKAATEQASRLCRQVRELRIPIQGGSQSLSVTISLGIAQYQHGVDTWDTLLNRADNAMYKAKSSGRDRWVVDA